MSRTSGASKSTMNRPSTGTCLRNETAKLRETLADPLRRPTRRLALAIDLRPGVQRLDLA
jgi:hypothetical protein